MKNNSQKIQDLKFQKDQLIQNFKISDLKTEIYKDTQKQIKTIEAQIKELQLIDKVNSINEAHKVKKELISEFLQHGLIDPKLITNERKLNKTLQKQNPGLYAAAEKNGARFGFDYDQNVVISIYKRFESIEFTLSFVDYTIDKKDRINTLFSSLEQACSKNRTLFVPLKLNEVKKQLQNINKATEKMLQDQKKYSEILENNNAYFLDNEKILSSSNCYLYLKSY
jgi:hypothetical protein